MNRLWLWLGAIVLTVAIVAFGLRQYRNARVAEAELETATEAISEAVAERRETIKVDARQQQERRATQRSVQSVVDPLKQEAQVVQNPCSDAGRAERLRLLNAAIAETNRSIDAAAKLHY